MAYSIDTRTLQPGDIFIPIKGPTFDGHAFIEEARRKGAAQILDVDLATYAGAHRRKFDIPVIAVTGSAGKTSTKDLLAAVMGQRFKVVRSAENQNNEVGVPLTLLKIEPEHEIAIVEMAMRGLGQIEYLANIAEPTHAIITNIGYAHIELLHTREAIALAKSEVMRRGQIVYLNQRDEYFDFLNTIAEERGAVVKPFRYECITEANQAAVIAVARSFGLTEAEIACGLASAQTSKHRLREVSFAGATIIDDTYNANPDAMRFALQVLQEKACGARMIAVLGDMKELGSAAVQLHAELPVAMIDQVVTVGELAAHIPHHVSFEADEHARVAAWLKNNIQPGDWILLKGSRSMQMEKILTYL